MKDSFDAQNDDLAQAVQSGDCVRARALFDAAFWRQEKLAPQWAHLKIALINEDRAMIKLLVTWGARAPEDAAALDGLAPQKYAFYNSLLKQCGINVPLL